MTNSNVFNAATAVKMINKTAEAKFKASRFEAIEEKSADLDFFGLLGSLVKNTAGLTKDVAVYGGAAAGELAREGVVIAHNHIVYAREEMKELGKAVDITRKVRVGVTSDVPEEVVAANPRITLAEIRKQQHAYRMSLFADSQK